MIVERFIETFGCFDRVKKKPYVDSFTDVAYIIPIRSCMAAITINN